MTEDSRPELSTAELVKQLTAGISQLIRDELKLAQAEMTRKGTDAAKGIGLFGGSGLIAIFGAACLIAAGVIGLAHLVAAWLAALIVGAGLLVIAGLAALGGKRELARAAPPVPEQAVQSVKTDVETIRESAHRA
jgi:Putative Actinobacterial Holin-X, holin superfamily III